jgi:glyoxylase-like metal-dependent hydrolase (beta-lactamase superfamily II)
MSGQPAIRAFFDEPTNTVSYLVADPTTKKAAIIDPVFDYDHNSGEVDTRSVEAVLKAAEEAGYTIEWVLETHAHADHLCRSPTMDQPRQPQKNSREIARSRTLSPT